MNLTALDALVIVTLLLLVLAVIRAWAGPIPSPLMRPAHVFKLGFDINILAQGPNTCKAEIMKRDVDIGDVVFIEQVSDRNQLFYISGWDEQFNGEMITLTLSREDVLK